METVGEVAELARVRTPACGASTPGGRRREAEGLAAYFRDAIVADAGACEANAVSP